MAGWQIAGFAELGMLGAGGGGRVVEAVDLASGEHVAVKYLADWLAADPGFRSAFRDEAQVLAGVTSPHVARVRGFAEEPGGRGAAIIMDLVPGLALREILARFGPTGPQAALSVLAGSLEGLAAAHAVGVVHRDYKPENVIVDPAGSSMLVDFGVAARTGSRPAVAGTPGYMAPEQLAGGSASPAGDIYAAAVTFTECLTGTPPRAGTRPALPADNGDDRLPGLIVRATSPDPAARPADAARFLTELRQAANDRYGPGWERAGRAALAGAAAALIGGAAAVVAGAGTGAAGEGGAGGGSAGSAGARPGHAPAAEGHGPVTRAATRVGSPRRTSRGAKAGRAGRAGKTAGTAAKGSIAHTIGTVGIVAAAGAVTAGAVIAAVVITRHHSAPAGAARAGSVRAGASVPLLGVASADPFQRGFGKARPGSITTSDGGGGWASNIRWQSWGGAQATGEATGVAPYAPGSPPASKAATARVVAFNLGTCNGHRVYTAVEWYFPALGQAFNPRQNYFDTCTHVWIGSGTSPAP